MPDRLPYLVEPMTLSDLSQVMAIEQVSFSAPWSARAYRYEITQNSHSTLLVVRTRLGSRGGLSHWLSWLKLARVAPVLGYAGFWLLVDDAHIATIAVHPAWRGQGLGDWLLFSILEGGARRGARRATLEVRLSNQVAQNLYHKFGFKVVSRRRRYYADNNEDAYLMATPPFETPEFRANLERCRLRLVSRLAQARAEAPIRSPIADGLDKIQHMR